MKKILVLGATGKQGGAVLHALRERGFEVRALTRDPQKPAAKSLNAEVVKGDLDDAASLRAAMHGVDGVFSVQTPYGPGGVERETREGIAVIDAAKAAGVKQLVYSSVGGAERNTGIPHFDSKWRVEQHLQKSGLHATVLRPVFFLENFATLMAPKDGVLKMPLSPQTKLQMIAVHDIGVFAALAFEGKVKGALEIAGDEMTAAEIAQTFGARFETVPAPNEESAKMFRWFEQHGYAADLGKLREIYPQLTTLQEWIAQRV